MLAHPGVADGGGGGGGGSRGKAQLLPHLFALLHDYGTGLYVLARWEKRDSAFKGSVNPSSSYIRQASQRHGSATMN